MNEDRNEQTDTQCTIELRVVLVAKDTHDDKVKNECEKLTG